MESRKRNNEKPIAIAVGFIAIVYIVIVGIVYCAGGSDEEGLSEQLSRGENFAIETQVVVENPSAEEDVRVEEDVRTEENPYPEEEAQDEEVRQEYPVLVAWEDAGMEDRIMDWKDENLQTSMEIITGITEGISAH